MKKIVLLAICCMFCCVALAQNKELSNIKIDTIYYDKNWKVAPSPLFADYYRLTMCDADNPQAGCKVRDYYITGELQGDGVCTYLGVNDDSETIWEGKVVTYFKNGKLSSERTYINGKLNGNVISYYENGLIDSKIPFVDDKIDGMALFFTDNGTKCKRVEYVNGELKNDYYELTDYNGCYSKFYHKDDKVKWVSPTTKEKQKAYRNGEIINYYENNGLTLAIILSASREYGNYLKFDVSVVNNSCESVDMKISNISASFKYPKECKSKKESIDVHILSAMEYDIKIRRRQNATKALVGLANGLAAAQAGYSASSTQINSGYAGGSASVGAAAAVGNGGWAVGVGASRSGYVGASSTSINTVSYDGFAAYQASMMANAQRQAMSKEMLEERMQKIDAYLKEDTIFPNDAIDGYFLIPRKIKGAAKYGGELCINFNINGANYLYEYTLCGKKESKQIVRDLINKQLRGKMSKAEAMEEAEKVYSYQVK